MKHKQDVLIQLGEVIGQLVAGRLSPNANSNLPF